MAVYDFAIDPHEFETKRVLVTGGTKGIGQAVAARLQGVVVKGSGHWLMEEAPGQVIPQIVEFINKSR